MIYTFNISLLLSDAELESHILALGVALIREKARTKPANNEKKVINSDRLKEYDDLLTKLCATASTKYVSITFTMREFDVLVRGVTLAYIHDKMFSTLFSELKDIENHIAEIGL